MPLAFDEVVDKHLLNSWNEIIVFGGSLPNHTLARPFSVIGKTLHMISFATP